MTKRAQKPRPYKHPYPENLIIEIGLENVFEANEYVPLSDDQLTGLEHAISTLKPAERTILKLRYNDLLTWRKIGETFERSPERVRQLGQRGIRKLRHPSRLPYIQFGMQGYTEWMEKKRVAEEALLNASLVDNPESLLEHLDYIPVENIGLSYRSISCLSYAGIKTVGQLYRMIKQKPEWAESIRNLGYRGKSDIRRALKKYGLSIQQESRDH